VVIRLEESKTAPLNGDWRFMEAEITVKLTGLLVFPVPLLVFVKLTVSL
jgi:hypothetical protein